MEWTVLQTGTGQWLVQRAGVILAMCGEGPEGERTARMVAAAPKLVGLLREAMKQLEDASRVVGWTYSVRRKIEAMLSRLGVQ